MPQSAVKLSYAGIIQIRSKGPQRLIAASQPSVLSTPDIWFSAII